MSVRDRRHRSIVWVSLLGAAAVVAALLWQQREPLRWRWYLFRERPKILDAREQILGWQESYKPSEVLTGALDDLRADGDLGFRAIASLLEDEDPRVWARTAMLIDSHFSGAGWKPETVREVVSYLRSRGQRSLLRYLIFPVYSHGTHWRSYSFYLHGEWKIDWRWYWSGEPGRALVPAPDGLSFCEDVLQDRFSSEDVWVEADDLEERAVDALAAMWDPDAPTTSRNGQALAVLERLVRSDDDPDLRLRALDRLAHRGGPHGDYLVPLLSDWERLAGICPPDVLGQPEEAYPALRDWFSDQLPDRASVSALLRLDHPRVLRVLARLVGDPRTKEAIEAARLPGVPGPPVTGPEWFPLEAAARRLLVGPPARRAAAGLWFADARSRDAVEVLRAAMSGEPDEDIRGLIECCIVALGDRAGGPDAAPRLEAWLRRGPGALEAGFSAADAIGQLLRVGDRSTLDRVVAEASREVRPDLLFALADVLEGFPLGNALGDAVSRLMMGFAAEDGEEGERPANEALSAWWAAHRERLAWDGGERRYRTRP